MASKRVSGRNYFDFELINVTSSSRNKGSELKFKFLKSCKFYDDRNSVTHTSESVILHYYQPWSNGVL